MDSRSKYIPVKKGQKQFNQGSPQFGHWAMPKRTGFFSVEVFLKEEQFRKLFMPIMFFHATFRSCLRFLFVQAIELTLKAELSQAPRPALPCKHGFSSTFTLQKLSAKCNNISRVALIVPDCQPGWEEMENLRRKFE